MKQRLQRVISCLVLCALLAGGTAPGAAAQFEDVPASHPAAEAIRRCVELGFFQGETASRFGVGHSITRGAFVVAAARFFGWDIGVKPDRPTYSDVPVGAWCSGAVEAAVAAGALTSESDTFRPDDAITREELAVLLVRALGYDTMAALVQDLPIPFRDVRTNPGYIAIAYDFGLVSGSTRTAFSPDEPAAREDVAVILMDLYDRLHAPAARRIGIAGAVEGLPDLAGYEVVAVPAGRLISAGTPTVAAVMNAQEAAALRETVQQAGSKAFLYVTGGTTALNGDAEETARVLAEAVEKGGYDGLFLDLEKLQLVQQRAMTRLLRALKPALNGRPLYVMADAPGRDGTTYEGYDYGLIGEIADCLVLRVCSYEGVTNGFPDAPIEPLEEVYYAFAELSGIADGGKLALLVSTSGKLYLDGQEAGELSREEIRTLLNAEDARTYYSDRYACAYLTASRTIKETREVKEAVAWYPDERTIDARARLAGLFGAARLCIGDLNNLPAQTEQDG